MYREARRVVTLKLRPQEYGVLCCVARACDSTATSAALGAVLSMLQRWLRRSGSGAPVDDVALVDDVAGKDRLNDVLRSHLCVVASMSSGLASGAVDPAAAASILRESVAAVSAVLGDDADPEQQLDDWTDRRRRRRVDWDGDGRAVNGNGMRAGDPLARARDLPRDVARPPGLRVDAG